MAGSLPIVDARIAGDPVRLLVDTGAVRSVLSPEAAQRLRLRRDPWVGDRVVGVAGVVSQYWNAITHSVSIGGVPLIQPEMAVAPLAGPVDGLLGADFWTRYDADLDLPQRRLTLYRAEPCVRQVAPWGEAAVRIQGVVGGPRNRLLLPASLDGVPTVALFDTGSEKSAVALRLARRLPPPTDGWRVARLRGVSTTAQVVPARRFARLTIGPLVFADSLLPLLPFFPGQANVLVGEDLLRGCRTWFSFANRQVFIARAPGDVLPCPASGG